MHPNIAKHSTHFKACSLKDKTYSQWIPESSDFSGACFLASTNSGGLEDIHRTRPVVFRTSVRTAPLVPPPGVPIRVPKQKSSCGSGKGCHGTTQLPRTTSWTILQWSFILQSLGFDPISISSRQLGEPDTNRFIVKPIQSMVNRRSKPWLRLPN